MKKALLHGLLLAALAIVPFGFSNLSAANEEVKVEKTARFRFGVSVGRPYYYYYRPYGYYRPYYYSPYYYRYRYYNYPYRPYRYYNW